MVKSCLEKDDTDTNLLISFKALHCLGILHQTKCCVPIQSDFTTYKTIGSIFGNTIEKTYVFLMQELSISS